MNNNNNNANGYVAVQSKRAARRAKQPQQQKQQQRPQKQPKQQAPRKQKRKQRQAQAAAAYATGQSSGAPRVYRDSVDSCRMVHRELIASVVGSVAFTVPNSFALNPGLAATFPWLSIEAQGWERYRFNSLKFCYYTRTGSNIPGSVMLAPDYDAADAAPASEQIASSYEDTEEDAPWKDIECALRVVDMLGGMKDKYVRTGGLPANQDVKMFDSGNLFLCTVDGTAVGWGKLWVEYDVTFFTPQLPPGGAAAVGTLQGAGGSFTAATPFGAAPVATGSFALNAAGTNVLSMTGLPIGAEISVNANFGGTVMTVCSFGTLVGLTLKTALAVSCNNAAATNTSATSTFTVTASVASLVVTVTATTVGAAQLVVSVLTPPPAF